MQRTSSSTLVVWAVIGTVLAVVVDVVLESQGFSLPGLPWSAVIGMLVLAAILLVLGWPIKKWNDGDRTKEIDPIQAARGAVMATEGALTVGELAGGSLASVGYSFISAPGIRSELAAGILIVLLGRAALTTSGIIIAGLCEMTFKDPPGVEKGSADT